MIYFHNDVATIYHGDCREVMASLSIHPEIIITSPPYNKSINYYGYNDAIPDSDFRTMNAEWLKAAKQCADPGVRLYACVGDKMLAWFQTLAIDAGWDFQRTLTWCKPNVLNFGEWSNSTEHFMEFHGNGPRLPMLKPDDVTTQNYFVIPSPQGGWKEEVREHPCQWPLDLPRTILKRTPGKIVLDPFCGSGSALVAAIGLGRKVIGIEIDEHYCEIAAKKVEEHINNIIYQMEHVWGQQETLSDILEPDEGEEDE